MAHGDLGHWASPSLGHYAALSFIVIGRSQRLDDRGQTTASQMVNLPTSQIVMNGANDALTV